jgi:hypothetical protein
MLRLFALAVLLCVVLPAGGDARPIDWPPTPLPPAPDAVTSHAHLPPRDGPCSR